MMNIVFGLFICAAIGIGLGAVIFVKVSLDMRARRKARRDAIIQAHRAIIYGRDPK